MRYCVEKAAIEMTLDELCDLSSHRGYPKGYQSSSETARQKCRDELAYENGIFFTPDHSFCFTCSMGGIHYEITGMADGILRLENNIYIYVIKCEKGRSQPNFSNPLWNMKTLCTAHLAASKFDCDTVKLRTVLYNTESGKKRIDEKEYSAAFLSKVFMGQVAKKERFARLAQKKATDVKDSISSMRFPFGNMRDGQRTLIEEAYRTIHDGNRLFAQAPTGIGKTISVLYPAVKALGDGLCDKIFYLTAKASTRREAFAAIKKMFEAGAELKAIILYPKDYMCSSGIAKLSGGAVSAYCSPDRCDKANGYFSRAEEAVYELLTTADGYTPALISEVAKKYNVCPYELSLDLSEYCDIIICDYNYVFDPVVSIRRYFGEDSARIGENYVFLTDEAHNLADRARDMYSAEIDLATFERFYSMLPMDEGRLSSFFEEIIRSVHALKKLCSDNMTKDENGNERGFYFSTTPPWSFSEKLQKFLLELENYSKKHSEEALSDQLFELLALIRKYLLILDYYDEHFRTYVLVDEGNIKVKIYCIDPSRVLDERMNKACASILFSATLTPTDYFVDVLGGSEAAVKLELPSPFPRENLCLAAMTGISTRHADRDFSASKIAVAIGAAVLPKKGNYIVYFPSYSFMERVALYFTKKFPAVNISVQKRGMFSIEKDKFLDFFKEDTDILRIGFCVLGGSFSEGIDLPGSRLIGSIIVGVGLPQLSNDLNIIRDFYELKYEKGYDYAYTYPGMNKVLQACGRVIRQESDCGIVVLIDDRYATQQYKNLFPEHWQNINFASSSSELAKIVDSFWRNTNNM